MAPRHAGLWLAAGLVLVCQGAWSVEVPYPTRAVRLVVPFAAGGYTDAIARVTARGFEARLGQPVVVTNITGAWRVVAATAATLGVKR